MAKKKNTAWLFFKKSKPYARKCIKPINKKHIHHFMECKSLVYKMYLRKLYLVLFKSHLLY